MGHELRQLNASYPVEKLPCQCFFSHLTLIPNIYQEQYNDPVNLALQAKATSHNSSISLLALLSRYTCKIVMNFVSRQYYGPVNSQIILLGAILTLSNLADIIHSSSRVYLFQQAQCLIYYKTLSSSKINLDHHVDESLCKVSQVQSRLSIVDGLDSFLTFIPRE